MLRSKLPALHLALAETNLKAVEHKKYTRLNPHVSIVHHRNTKIEAPKNDMAWEVMLEFWKKSTSTTTGANSQCNDERRTMKGPAVVEQRPCIPSN